jgi:hypothetical protein
MTCNVGVVERGVRIVMGGSFLALGALGGLPGVYAAVAFVVGAILVLTGAVGFCPAWKLLGVNTCPVKR